MAPYETVNRVLEKDHQLEYSESYFGNVHGEPTIEGNQYCVGLKRAFESLISEQYRSYILTVGCIAVGIICFADNGHLKCLTHMLEMFMVKSHSRNLWSIRYIIYRQLSASLSNLNGATDLYELQG